MGRGLVWIGATVRGVKVRSGVPLFSENFVLSGKSLGQRLTRVSIRIQKLLLVPRLVRKDHSFLCDDEDVEEIDRLLDEAGAIWPLKAGESGRDLKSSC